MNYSKLVDTLAVPAVVGATAAGVAYFGMGEKGNVPFYGTTINGAIGVFGAVGTASLIGEYLKNYLLPYIPSNSNYAELEATLINPVLTGVSSAALFRLAAMQPIDGLSLPPPSLGRTFLLGAGSEVAGKYLYDGLVSQYIPK